jgi:hypothetical protein
MLYPLNPHCPKGVIFIKTETVIGAPVSFSSLIFVRLPSGLAPSGALHGSVFASVEAAWGAVVGVSATRKAGVSVGRGVCVGVSVGVSVGGKGVDVGIAACVSAIMVSAAATDVFWMLTMSTVGVAGELQALTNIVTAIMKDKVRIYFIVILG